MKFKNLFTVAILFLSVISVSAQDTLGLDAAITEAMKNNHSIIIAKHTASIASNNSSAGNAGLWPKIDASAGANTAVTDTRVEYANNLPVTEQSGASSQNINASISLSYTLFDGFGNVYTFQKLKAANELAEFQSKQQIENTLILVVNAYYQLAKQSQNLAINEELIRISNNRLERANVKNEFGGSSIERLNAEVDLNSDSLSYANSRLAFIQARNNLNLILGRPLYAEVFVSSSIVFNKDITLVNLINESTGNNSGILAASKSKRIAELDNKIAIAARMPKLSLSSSYGFNESQNDAGFVLLSRTTGPSAGLTLSFNLFDGGRKNIVIKNALLNSEINRQRYEESVRKVETEINNAFLNYQNNLFVLALTERNLKTAERNFERTEELFSLGQITGLQFRDAQLNFVLAQSRILDAKYNTKISEMELMKISGKLVQ